MHPFSQLCVVVERGIHNGACLLSLLFSLSFLNIGGRKRSGERASGMTDLQDPLSIPLFFYRSSTGVQVFPFHFMTPK